MFLCPLSDLLVSSELELPLAAGELFVIVLIAARQCSRVSPTDNLFLSFHSVGMMAMQMQAAEAPKAVTAHSPVEKKVAISKGFAAAGVQH